jgi:hypothetical protein
VAVFIPEYVVEHWWEHLLHNQSALRLKARLLFQTGVMVTSVPWRFGTDSTPVGSEGAVPASTAPAAGPRAVPPDPAPRQAVGVRR